MKKYTFAGDAKLEKSLVSAGLLVPLYDGPDATPTPAKQPDKYIYSGSVSRDKLHIGYTVYNNAISVAVYEKFVHKQVVARALKDEERVKTLYSQIFYEFKDLALKNVDDIIRGKEDADDLIFRLKELKEEEIKVNG
jgi:hypothetical protein